MKIRFSNEEIRILGAEDTHDLARRLRMYLADEARLWHTSETVALTPWEPMVGVGPLLGRVVYFLTAYEVVVPSLEVEHREGLLEEP